MGSVSRPCEYLGSVERNRMGTARFCVTGSGERQGSSQPEMTTAPCGYVQRNCPGSTSGVKSMVVTRTATVRYACEASFTGIRFRLET